MQQQEYNLLIPGFPFIDKYWCAQDDCHDMRLYGRLKMIFFGLMITFHMFCFKQLCRHPSDALQASTALLASSRTEVISCILHLFFMVLLCGKTLLPLLLQNLTIAIINALNILCLPEIQQCYFLFIHYCKISVHMSFGACDNTLVQCVKKIN